MTLSGSSIPSEQTLSSELIESLRCDGQLFDVEGLDLYLIRGDQFPAVAEAVGRLRESTYREQLSGSGETLDLDGRDQAYDHLLLVETNSGVLAGSARLQFLPAGSRGDPDPPCRLGDCGDGDLAEGTSAHGALTSHRNALTPGSPARLGKC